MSNTHTERSAVSSSQPIQAEHMRMVKRSRLELPTTKPGANDLYTIYMKGGILKGTFVCNQLDICPQRNQPLVDKAMSNATVLAVQSASQTDASVSKAK